MKMNIESFTKKLETLKFSGMYNDDFLLTWEKSDDEIDAVFAVADALRLLRKNNISTGLCQFTGSC